MWREDAPSFFIAKGTVDSLFEEMKIKGHTYVPSEEVFLHKGKSADIMLDKARIGFIGELSPGMVEKLDLKINKPEIVMFEMDLDKLFSFVPGKLTYMQIPKYPAIERDIAIVLDAGITSAEVMRRADRI